MLFKRVYQTLQTQVRYRNRGILRGNYPYKKQDGTPYEYNETITVIPKEFEEQDEYYNEKQETKYWQEKYKVQKERNKQQRTIKLPLKECERKQDLTKMADDNLPVRDIDDPYKEEMHQCIFCKHNIPIDYKNVQMLTQFISPQTGFLFRQEITGLCLFKYQELELAIKRARMGGLMPIFYKSKEYINDPVIFETFKNNLLEIPTSYDKRDLDAEQG